MPRIIVCIFLFLIPLLNLNGQDLSKTNENSITRQLSISAFMSRIPMTRAVYTFQKTVIGPAGILDTILGADLTPISFNAFFTYQFAFPVTNLQLSAGLRAGTGWPLSGFGNGIGMQSNFYDQTVGTNVYAEEFLVKDLIKAWAGTALSYDLAQAFPGDWNHIQIRTYQEIYYRYLLGSNFDNDTWMFENIPDNMKAFRYYANYSIGYQMPSFLKYIGFLIESDLDVTHYSESTIASGGWGSDMFNMTVGFTQTFSFDQDNRLTLDFLIQWKNDRDYKPGKGSNVTLWQRELKSQYDYWHMYGVTWKLNYQL